MNDILISYHDLMTECNIQDEVEFRRVLRRRGFLHVPRNKSIEPKMANNIVRALTGHNIDLYKYKQQIRAIADVAALERKSSEAIRNLVDKWFARIIPESSVGDLQQDRLLGMVCAGGFLAGSGGSEFIIHLAPGMSVFIGDRGSGKSTILNLLGLLANSVSEDTRVLVSKLIGLLGETADETAVFHRRVLKILKGYGIRKYACFFTREQTVYCYYVDIGEGTFDYLRLRDPRMNTWESVAKIDGPIGPSMAVLLQGEVIRITDESNRVYLNNILDALYPDLYRKRMNFTQSFRRLADQFENTSVPNVAYKLHEAFEFMDERRVELRRIQRELERGYLSDGSIHLIRRLVDAFYAIDRSELPKAIFELLQSGEDALYYLYIGRIIGFLSRTIREVERMRAQETKALLRTTETRIDETAEEVAPAWEAVRDELLKDLSADKEALDELEEPEAESQRMSGETGQPEAETKEDRAERELFLRAMEQEKRSPASKEILNASREVINFLETRLRIFRSWVLLYSKPRVRLNESVMALIRNFSQLIQNRIDLISEQEKKCRTITGILQKGDLEIRVFTRGAEETIAEHKVEIAELGEVSSLYQQLMQATPESRLGDLLGLARNYDGIMEQTLERLGNLHKEVKEQEPAFPFNPIDVELLQGNTYRGFHQLSFGQKSGIILKMLLDTTDKRVIIIDQPEDNLDANSIVYMLAPTLSRLGSNRQVIIATHESNLVMGLPKSNLVVLESLGENGRIRLQGSLLYESDVVKEMLEVLEGGMYTFHRKMKMYEDFVSRLKSIIRDTDLAAIESSFRRRTIDGLRNFLQPIVSDRDVIEAIRHELKQRDPTQIDIDIRDTKRQIEEVKHKMPPVTSSLIERLDKLCDHLNSHVSRMWKAIEDMRLMDTEPKRHVVDLFTLLTELREEYRSTMSKKRDVQIYIDDCLQGQSVWADPAHLKLVFRNLFNNSFRATERRVFDAMDAGHVEDLSERLTIKLVEGSEQQVRLLFRDNGCGMPPEIRQKLYIERCSDQKGRDHGMGGAIIRKLLDANEGSIRILESRQSGAEVGTLQEICLAGHRRGEESTSP